MISAQLLANTRRLAAAARAEKGEGMGWCVPTGSKQAPSPIPTHPTSPPAAVPTSSVHPRVSRVWVMLRGWKEDFSLDEHG